MSYTVSIRAEADERASRERRKKKKKKKEQPTYHRRSQPPIHPSHHQSDSRHRPFNLSKPDPQPIPSHHSPFSPLKKKEKQGIKKKRKEKERKEKK
ncbi:uncharacterized protein ARB_00628 [Trichophyton benhamiae CBS 112371]|uniref:Uncharacterized protein n=1 Tax=Arthroderma benhamiae (strain ATCC MYA-4681 / CBS 112371) TaxID=663331 RepID=D4AWR2_ARTBC|nr:uncharacterized protein ARB_00628 [Trichophyton benhamiae CBS 112371]EFE32443.1 hypothetical protein ARB_00628 [Trichophyton benhamiae CBS 112371]